MSENCSNFLTHRLAYGIGFQTGGGGNLLRRPQTFEAARPAVEYADRQSGRGGSIDCILRGLYKKCTDQQNLELWGRFVHFAAFCTDFVIPPGIVDFVAFCKF